MTRSRLQRSAAAASAFACALAAAQTPPPADNSAAIQAWTNAAGDGTVPQVVQQPDGTSRLEWKSTVAIDGYRNDITPPPAPPGSPPFATALKSGDFAKGAFTTDLRMVAPEGIVSYAQGALLATNDRAVLTRYPNQITTLQAGRTAPNQQISAGDVAANLSTLGSTLGLRGLYMSQLLDTWQLLGHAGVIAESWDALANRKPIDNSPARTRYLRDVFGAKVEKALIAELKAYVSAQGFRDRPESLPPSVATMAPADGRSATAGFAWQQANATLTGEIAASAYQERDQDEREGTAKVLDGTWRIDAWNLRAGWHDIDPKFVSLSQVVPPGVRETYFGADWTAAPWLMLGADARDATMRTPEIIFKPPVDPLAPIDPSAPIVAPPPAPGSTTKARSITSRATLNFGPDLPGWTATLQDMEIDGKGAQGEDNRSSNWNALLGYASPTWTANAGVGGGRLSNAAFSAGDSRTRVAQLMLGRMYSDAAPTGMPLWNFMWSLAAQHQVQELVSTGGETRMRNITFTFGGQRVGWGQLNVMVGESVMTQPTGGPDLTTRSIQVDAIRPLSGQNFVKAYYREARRNQGDPNLHTDEQTAGIQLSVSW